MSDKPTTGKPLTYESAGVDIEEAERAIRGFQDSIRSTYTPQVLSDVGSFGGMFSGVFTGIENPVLASSIDGIGTKTKIASMVGSFRGLGRDIVSHCVNDILCVGARPLFFLDYYASSKLSAEQVVEIVQGMVEMCREVECALVGGELAEMPSVYCECEFDIVGAIIGVVDKNKVYPSENIFNGDLIIGIASDGLHTNGYSLARCALFEKKGRAVTDVIPELGRTLGEELLRPHRCYFSSVYPLLQEEGLIKAVAHITGGGFQGNVPRVLPKDARAVIERRSWTVPPIFEMIQSDGEITIEEMYKTFNMGIGMILICASETASAVVQRLNDAGESAYVIGEITKGLRGVNIV